MFENLGMVTYGFASLLLFSLLIAQIRMWSGGISSSVLLVAILVTVVWSLVVALQDSIPFEYYFIVPVLELLKNSFWFALLLSVLGARKLLFSKFRDGEGTTELFLVTAITLGIPFLLAVYILLIQFLNYQIIFFPSYGGRLLISGFLLTSIAGLALLEQLIRNVREHHIWHIKFLCLSMGIWYTYDIFLYSNALLFERIDDQLWDARGIIVALATPLVAISVIRTSQQPIQVNISRRLVFHSGVFIVAGVYLLLMSLAGFYINDFSGQSGLLIQVVFWVVSLSLLVMLIYSGRLRSNLKLYINRHLFSSKYDYRDEWMRISNTLSQTSIDDSLPERVIHAFADTVDSPGGALWLTSNSTHFDQCAHLEMGWVDNSCLSSDDFLIQYLSETPSMINLADLPENISLDQFPKWLLEVKKAWLIVPLMLNGKLIGFVLLKESRAEFELNWEDFELMNAAGQQAASYLAQMVSSDALSEVRQFSAFNQVSAFVVHDIKTLNSQLSLMVENAEKHKTNPSFIEDMIKTTDHAVNKMSLLLEHFKSKEGEDAVIQERVNLIYLANEIIGLNKTMLPVPKLQANHEAVFVYGNESDLKSSIVHLVTNAQQATEDSGSIAIKISIENGKAILEVIDSGSGMTKEFINTKLFKPFESTKGLAGMGVGVYQSRTTIRNMGGDLAVESEFGKGSRFKITLPLLENDAD